jgi:hypothetical protein
MTIDQEAMVSVFEDAFLPFVIKHHGPKAGPAVRAILTFIKGFYQSVAAPESLNDEIIVFQTLDDAHRPIAEAGIECTALTESVNKVVGPCAIQIVPSGIFILWANHSSNAAHLSERAVVYSFHKGVERFHANRESKDIKKLIPGRTSNFAVPTFNSLKDALASYRIRRSGRRPVKSWTRPGTNRAGCFSFRAQRRR